MSVWVLSMASNGQSFSRRQQDSSIRGRRRCSDVLFCHLGFPIIHLETVSLPVCPCVILWGVLFRSTLHSTEVEASAHRAQWAWWHRPVTPASWEPEVEGWQFSKALQSMRSEWFQGQSSNWSGPYRQILRPRKNRDMAKCWRADTAHVSCISQIPQGHQNI